MVRLLSFAGLCMHVYILFERLHASKLETGLFLFSFFLDFWFWYRLLFEPHENGNELVCGIIESLRNIWIFRGVGIWSFSILIAGIPYFWLKFFHFFRQRYGTSHYERALLEGHCIIIVKGCIWFCIGIIIWIFCTFVGIICCELIIFSPFPVVIWYTRHRPFVKYVSLDLISKQLFDFVLYNRALNTNLEKLQIMDKNGSQLSQLNDEQSKNVKNNYKENLNSNEITIVKNYKLSDKNRDQLVVNEKERMFRLLLLNYCCIKYLEYTKDEKLIIFLTNHTSTDWKNIEFSQLQQNCDNQSSVTLPRGIECISYLICILSFIVYNTDCTKCQNWSMA